MSTPVVDAEALKEFFEKAVPQFPSGFLATVSKRLEERTRVVRTQQLAWPQLWDLAPVSRRIHSNERKIWEPRLEPLMAAIEFGHVGELFGELERWPDRPQWLVDWATYWLHLGHPEHLWWARWVYRADNRTGSLLLILDDPEQMVADDSLSQQYQKISDAVRFLESVLSLTHPLDDVEDVYRTQVALATVYAVYMFTMAAWKMTEEFTQVLPSFPVVIKNLLGVTRWEGKYVGTEGQTN